MNEYINANRKAWATLSKDHYHTFKDLLENNDFSLNKTQIDELGDIQGKSIIHLQCNTGADTISLARLGAKEVVGVDLVPENIQYAKQLSTDLNVSSTSFIEANVLELKENHNKKYDIVFTTDGVLIWLPDLELWASNVRHLLNDDGFLYLMDGHPTFMAWDEMKLPELHVKYPYFNKFPEQDEWIGGYASELKQSTNYGWMYTISDIINALSNAGLHVEWFHEFDWLFFKVNEKLKTRDENGHWIFPEYRGKLPFTFSLKATIR
jgi:SAM-dependent methyltransferase